jgi:XTP/dITP diphosphohydrolase
MKLLFATHNQNKAEEIRAKLPSSIELITLNDLHLTEEIPETGKTLEENARIKAQFLVDKFNLPCFADDTGLEIEALGGSPGVYSARYAGESKNSEDNMQKVLQEMITETNRNARFRTVISLFWKNEFHQIEGIAKGNILTEKSGEKGFGYDPIFQPEGYTVSFAQMSLDEKNIISHRALAIDKMMTLLSNNQ